MDRLTRQEARQMLTAMENVSRTFYAGAVGAGCHAFIEFTGLMNEYIKICSGMTEAGDLSWVDANTHKERPLTMQAFQAQYLAEKLDCIYGPTLRSSPELKEAFEGHAP